jgi:hypothetical protein
MQFYCIIGTVVQEILYNTLDCISSKKRRKKPLTGKTKYAVDPVVGIHQVCKLYYSTNLKKSVHNRFSYLGTVASNS